MSPRADERPPDAQPPDRADRPVHELLATYCRPHWPHFLAAVGSQLLARLLWLLPPVVLGVAFDAVFADAAPYRLPLVGDWLVPADVAGQFWLSVGLLAAGKLGGNAIYLLGSWARTVAAYRVQHDLRADAVGVVAALDVGFFERERTGQVLSILNSDVNELETFLNSTLQIGANATLMLVGASAFMLALNWQLALVAFVPPALVAATNLGFARYVEPRHEAIRERVGDVNSQVETVVGGIHVVKAFDRADDEVERLRQASAAYMDASWTVGRARVLVGQVTGGLANATQIVVFLVGGTWVLATGAGQPAPGPLSGTLTAGTLLSFLLYANHFHWPLTQVTSVVDSYEEARAAAGRVLGLLDESRTVPQPVDPVRPDRIDGRIDVADVTFAYPGDDPALRDLSLTAAPGETVGVVGPTGAGKSTLAKLLLRFYDPDEGTLRLDGHDLRALDLSALREGVAYVGQDAALLAGTVRENVAYARPDADDRAVREAAELAAVDEFVDDLPAGYDTEVGERGDELSGGQRQRIALARAILADPAVLVLDEATSHVDNRTEAVVQTRLADFLTDRTVIAIAHRLSTVRCADRIVVVEDGTITERGAHEDLLAADGIYADLWQVQVGEVEALPRSFTG